MISKKLTQSLLFLLFLLFQTTIIFGQAPRQLSSAEIYSEMERLNFLGSALYVAAHPDDENTNMIAFLSNHYKARTAYLSMTRGDGGQNLIGPELRELLGLLRTQELLAARRIDGGNQMFTRANDFGYSKKASETISIWEKDKVLADVVWAIRTWQPDVIINRFNHEDVRRTHGHHTASAQLSFEAFDLAGQPNQFPEQLSKVNPWTPKRLFFNTSWWFYGSQENFNKADKSNMVAVDIGTYYPLLGKSNNEIAALSRSQHRCQGFGRLLERGSRTEYLQLLKGDMPASKADVFEGINTTWTRVSGGEIIGKAVDQLLKEYDFGNPGGSVDQLVKIYSMIEALDDGYWKKVKLEETRLLIKECLGLHLECLADNPFLTPGSEMEITLEALNRSAVPVKLSTVSLTHAMLDTAWNASLDDNEMIKLFKKVALPENTAFTSPYWLEQPGSLGMYTVNDQDLIGKPETPQSFVATFSVEILETKIDYSIPMVFKKSDPVEGEVYKPFEVVPPVTAKIDGKVFIFSSNTPKKVPVVLNNYRESQTGKVSLSVPRGWKVEPSSFEYDFDIAGLEKTIEFTVFPSANQSEGFIYPKFEHEKGAKARELVRVEYDHIHPQVVIRTAEAKVVRLDIKKNGERVAYIMGAGDAVPENLREVGYQVDVLDPATVSSQSLAAYDAVLTGVRAYNTIERMPILQRELLGYVEAGGTLIVQYNTYFRLKLPSEEVAPYPLKISRDRVTVEEAEVRVLEPSHPILNQPNKITSADFEGWVQERGLYFADEWGSEFTPILSCNDPGEDSKEGGLLVAKYGKGHYVYTGYSWFRQLPAGVPGAFRLFTNIVSLGSENKTR